MSTPFFLQQINGGPPGMTDGPAAASDPFVSFFENQEHYGYRDSAGTIWDAWGDGNLQQINGGPPGRTDGPAAVGGPFIWTVGNQQHFTYRDQAGTIYDPWFHSDAWNLQRINGGPPGRTDGPPATGDPFVSVFGNQQHVGYRDSAGTIWDSWYDGAKGRWNLQQINGGPPGRTDGPPAIGGPFIWTVGNQQHFTYRDQAGTIYDSWFHGGGWNLQQINGGPPGRTDGPLAVGDPFVSVFGSQQHVFYRVVGLVIYDSWFHGGGWNLQQINGGPPGQTEGPPAVGDPFAFVFDDSMPQPGQHIGYRDKAGAIYDSWFDGGGWNLQQINGHSPPAMSDGPPAVGGPFIWFADPDPGLWFQHFAYRDREGMIFDSMVAGPVDVGGGIC